MRDLILNYRRLKLEAPEYRTLELDHRIQPLQQRSDEVHTLGALLWSVSSYLIFFVLLTASWQNPDPAAGMWQVVQMLTGFMLYLFAVTLAGRFSPAMQFLFFWCAIGPFSDFIVLATRGYNDSVWFRLGTTCVGTGALGYLVAGTVRHYLNWMLADPALPRPVRLLRRPWYERLFTFRRNAAMDAGAEAKSALRNMELDLLGAFRPRLCMLVGLYIVGSLIPYEKLRWGVCLLAPPCAAMALFLSDHKRASLHREGTQRASGEVRAALTLCWRSFVSWTRYGRFGTDAPGVFQSPLGGFFPRLGVTILCALLSALLTVTVFECLLPFPLLYRLLVGATLLFGSAGSLLLFTSRAIEGAEGWETEAYHATLPEPRPQNALTVWEQRVQRLSQSPVGKEREHLWLGNHLREDFPLLLDRAILKEHAYIVGDSGSGKTALGVMPLTMQLIRNKGASEEPGGIVLIDLKGDPTLFHTAKEEAERAGLTFKWFSIEKDASTYAFNPFAQETRESLSLSQLCEMFLEALSLNHGEGYGRSFYSRVAREWLQRTLSANPDVTSFQELVELSKKEEKLADEEERRNAYELIAVIRALASIEALNITASLDPQVAAQAIHMPDVIKERQVVYFWLPALRASASVREIAKLVLYALVTAANVYASDSENPPAQSYLIIDEFQRIASANFKIILEQARSMGIGAILSNQSIADLKTRDADLRYTVLTNTRLKLVYSAPASSVHADNMLDFWVNSAGLPLNEEDLDLTQLDTPFRAFYENVPQLRSPIKTYSFGPSRFRQNEVIMASDDPTWFILHIPRGSGYSQFSGFPIIARGDYAITLAERREREASGWPAHQPGITLTNRSNPPVLEKVVSAPTRQERMQQAKILEEETLPDTMLAVTFHQELREERSGPLKDIQTRIASLKSQSEQD